MLASDVDIIIVGGDGDLAKSPDGGDGERDCEQGEQRQTETEHGSVVAKDCQKRQYGEERENDPEDGAR